MVNYHTEIVPFDLCSIADWGDVEFESDPYNLDAHGDTCLMFGGTRVSDASIFQLATVQGSIDPEHAIQIGMHGRGIYRCEFSQASGLLMIKIEEFKQRGVEKVVEEAHHMSVMALCILRSIRMFLIALSCPGQPCLNLLACQGRRFGILFEVSEG